MISDDERREVAARLRSKKPEEFTFPFGKPVLMHIFRSVFPCQMFLTNWILRLPYKLADLIDRPTCYVVEHKTHCGSYGCEEAGTLWVLSCGDECVNDSDFPPRYCPDCGARVVSADD